MSIDLSTMYRDIALYQKKQIDVVSVNDIVMNDDAVDEVDMKDAKYSHK